MTEPTKEKPAREYANLDMTPSGLLREIDRLNHEMNVHGHKLWDPAQLDILIEELDALRTRVSVLRRALLEGSIRKYADDNQ